MSGCLDLNSCSASFIKISQRSLGAAKIALSVTCCFCCCCCADADGAVITKQPAVVTIAIMLDTIAVIRTIAVIGGNLLQLLKSEILKGSSVLRVTKKYCMYILLAFEL